MRIQDLAASKGDEYFLKTNKNSNNDEKKELTTKMKRSLQEVNSG